MSDEAPPQRIARYRILLLLLPVAMLFLIPWLAGGPSGILAAINKLREFGPIALFYLAGMYALACLLMAPGILLTVAAGFLAAVFWPGEPIKVLAMGYLTVFAGSVTGCTLAFLTARTLARDFVARHIANSPRFAALDHAIGNGGFRIVFLLRLSPLFPFNFLNYALGLTRVSLRDYMLASAIGMAPGTLLYVYIGATANELTTAAATGQAELGWARTAMLVVGLIATFAVVAYVTRMARRALKEADPSVDQVD